jgi:predicted DNA-binding transcriptional regulator YafY
VRINILKSMQHSQIAEMIYLNNKGEISKRRVKVLSVSTDSFQAYCFLRGTKRTFKIENVLAFVPVVNRERDVI